jgi:hypothetical protein
MNAKQTLAYRAGGSKLNNGQMGLYKSLNIIFVFSAMMFNILVSVVYVSTKLDFLVLRQISGIIIISLIIPFTITLRGYLREKAEKKIIFSNMIVLLYLVLELLLDYILKIPFRDILALHIPYIIVFYAAEFSMMSVSFNINRKIGLIVVSTFVILIGCLAYLYLG